MNYRLKSIILFPMNILYSFNPQIELRLMFRIKQGYKLNLKNPKTYNEKLNWQKLFYHNELFGICSDKYLVREYVKKRGCEYILNDLLWSGFCAEDIPFDDLPNRFVIKATHGSGFNIICKDKSKLDRKESIRKLNRWLKTKFLKCYGEHWYGENPPRIIIEKYLEDPKTQRLFDYKFFCFNGEPHYVYIDTWKNGRHHINMYDIDFSLRKEVSLGYPTDFSSDIVKPENYNEMLQIVRKLSHDFPHVRVDLYNVEGNIIFGEMTFSKGAGFDKISPFEFDLEMGAHFLIKREYKEG